jgi:hypothetical protein
MTFTTASTGDAGGDAGKGQGMGMERADWLADRINSADARFLMVTAITHHRFSSPIWGAR